MGNNRVTVRNGDVNVRALMVALTFAPDAKVGFPEETTGPEIHADSNLSMAALASIHELGKGNVPPRPFMRQGAEIMLTRRGLIVPHLQRMLTGRAHAGLFMHAVGALLKNSILASISRQAFTPLSPATIKAKGSSEILVDTSAMRDSVDVHVERGG